MRLAKLLHNPEAGEGGYKEEDLIALIESKGFRCEYESMKKKDWKKISPEIDFLVVTGGDGTVRKVVKKLLGRKLLDKRFPIALLAAGTANNIAKTLNLDEDAEMVVESWNNCHIKDYDVGRIYNLPRATFFMEGLGFGVFPALMKQMRKAKEDPGESPGQKMQRALKHLYDIIVSYEPRYCQIEADGKDCSGSYLLVELMNIRSIGPNLHFAEKADPGDGKFELVLVAEHQRNDLATYVMNKISGVEVIFSIEPLSARNVTLKWEGSSMHVDDELLKNRKDTELKIEMHHSLLAFFVKNQLDVL